MARTHVEVEVVLKLLVDGLLVAHAHAVCWARAARTRVLHETSEPESDKAEGKDYGRCLKGQDNSKGRLSLSSSPGKGRVNLPLTCMRCQLG